MNTNDAGTSGFVEHAVQLIMNSEMVYAKLNEAASRYLGAEGDSVQSDASGRIMFMMLRARSYTYDVISASYRVIQWGQPDLLDKGYYPTTEQMLEVIAQVGRKALERVRAIEGGL